jgi:ABC-type branched-subunit amino acid transport system ATPase component
MRLTYRSRFNSIDRAVANDELANFIVLSGPNGSGKSNLLEAIQNGAMGVDSIPNPPEQTVRLFKLAQLIREAEPAQTTSAFAESWTNLKNTIDGHKQSLMSHPRSLGIDSPELQTEIRNHLLQNKFISTRVLDKIEQSAGKPIVRFGVSDYQRNAPLLIGQRDPFTLSVTEVFLSYHGRRNRNQQAQWLKERGAREDLNPLTDEEFTQAYGAPPWELLNETLKLVGIGDYSFNHPEGLEENVSYEAKLTDRRSENEIRVDQLSSGERTLLAVALTLYTGSEFEDSIELPKVLLLDEADASLHPLMISSLLKVVKDIFVDKYGVKVILTTHSPTTVALAPEESLYIMKREGAERLVKAVSRDAALKVLTVGLPTQSVKFEDRRQIFVESEIDSFCHDALYQLVKNDIQGTISLDFIESGRGGSGNCDAVELLVRKLRQAGNETVKGLIDRDTRTSAPEAIHFSAERYSIENFVLDPLAIGLFLIRETYINPTEMGLPADFKYFQLDNHGQAIINHILTQARESNDDTTTVPVRYADGQEFQVERWYLELQGHDLQARLQNKFLQLRRHTGDSLLRDLIVKLYKDLPSLVPNAIVNLYRELST